jgi:hypothetical protein
VNVRELADTVSPAEQAAVARREMRRSLVKLADTEAEMRAKAPLNETLDKLLGGRALYHIHRAATFALVYLVETDVTRRGKSS